MDCTVQVLSDPQKRDIYDVYGREGLRAGLEVGERVKTHEELRRDWERFQKEKVGAAPAPGLGTLGLLGLLPCHLHRWTASELAAPKANAVEALRGRQWLVRPAAAAASRTHLLQGLPAPNRPTGNGICVGRWQCGCQGAGEPAFFWVGAGDLG